MGVSVCVGGCGCGCEGRVCVCGGCVCVGGKVWVCACV